MITVFNRSELTVCGTLEQSQKVSAALEQAGIEYHVASHSRTSPSVFSAGTRERSGTFGQSAADSWTYTIYASGRIWNVPEPACADPPHFQQTKNS